MSNNIVLAWPNLVDIATLTSPQTWLATLPLSNLQDPVFGHVAKTASTTVTINSAFADYRQIGAMALPNHNLSVTATVRIYMYYDAAQTTLLYDTGDILAWPRVYDSVQLNWEDTNFWDGTPTNEQRAQFTPLFVNFLPQLFTVRSVKIVITDSANPDGFIKLGRLFLAPYFIPEFNTTYDGFERSQVTTTQISDCKGTAYFQVRKTKRRQTINLAFLSESEALQRIYMMQLTQGIDKEILYSDKLTTDQYSIITSMIGNLESLSPLTQPNLAQRGAKINILEKF